MSGIYPGDSLIIEFHLSVSPLFQVFYHLTALLLRQLHFKRKTLLLLPAFLLDALSGLSGCMGPVSMILAGCVIATFDPKKILLLKDVYIIVAVRMLLMPALAFALGKLLNLPPKYFFLLVVFHCLPAGLNTVVYPSTIGKDSSLGAGLAVISNLVAIITVPLFFSFVS